jgi:hypothetical protein
LMEQWFGKWKGMMVSIFTSLIIVLGVMTTVGCYTISCVRGLIQRLRPFSPNRRRLLPRQYPLIRHS